MTDMAPGQGGGRHPQGAHLAPEELALVLKRAWERANATPGLTDEGRWRHIAACVLAGDGDQQLPPARGARPVEEPPSGSVVAIGWGDSHQEVWVHNQSNIGNWYTTDARLQAGWHPLWQDVLDRAEGRSLVLLAAGDSESYALGYQAAKGAAVEAATGAIEELGPLS